MSTRRGYALLPVASGRRSGVRVPNVFSRSANRRRTTASIELSRIFVVMLLSLHWYRSPACLPRCLAKHDVIPELMRPHLGTCAICSMTIGCIGIQDLLSNSSHVSKSNNERAKPDVKSAVEMRTFGRHSARVTCSCERYRNIKVCQVWKSWTEF